MKKQYILILSLLTLVTFCGIYCNKIADQIKRNAPAAANVARIVRSLATDSTNPSYVLIGINSYVDNLADSTISVNATSYFTDSATNKKAKLTSVAINSRVINASADSVVAFCYTDSSGTIPAEGKALAGTNMAVKVTGSTVADTVTSMVYMPKNVLRYSTDIPPAGGVDNSDNLTLHWVADPNTAYNYVKIEIQYDGVLSQWSNPSLPATDTTLSYLVPDNGSYTISLTDLSHYPTGCYVQIIMGRGSQVQARLPVSGRLVYFGAISTVMTVPLKVNNL